MTTRLWPGSLVWLTSLGQYCSHLCWIERECHVDDTNKTIAYRYSLYCDETVAAKYLAFLPSSHLVNITIVVSLYSQIMRQKSPTLSGTGPRLMISLFINIPNEVRMCSYLEMQYIRFLVYNPNVIMKE